jgi:hypothetical protein
MPTVAPVVWPVFGYRMLGNVTDTRQRAMAETKSTRNSGEEWSEGEVQEPKELADGNTPTGVMSVKLGRSEGSDQVEGQSRGNLTVTGEPATVRRRFQLITA